MSLSDILTTIQQGVTAVNNLGSQIQGSFLNIQGQLNSLSSQINSLSSSVAASSGVRSFNSRVGVVVPAQGDYPTSLIPGTTSSNAAVAGNIGESGVAFGATSSNYTSGAPQLVGTLALPSAGDYDVYGYNDFGGTGGTATSDWVTIITTSSAATITNAGLFPVGQVHNRAPSGLDFALRQSIGPIHYSSSSAQTLYMYGQITSTSAVPVYNSNTYMQYRRPR